MLSCIIFVSAEFILYSKARVEKSKEQLTRLLGHVKMCMCVATILTGHNIISIIMIFWPENFMLDLTFQHISLYLIESDGFSFLFVSANIQLKRKFNRLGCQLSYEQMQTFVKLPSTVQKNKRAVFSRSSLILIVFPLFQQNLGIKLNVSIQSNAIQLIFVIVSF